MAAEESSGCPWIGSCSSADNLKLLLLPVLRTEAIGHSGVGRGDLAGCQHVVGASACRAWPFQPMPRLDIHAHRPVIGQQQIVRDVPPQPALSSTALGRNG